MTNVKTKRFALVIEDRPMDQNKIRQALESLDVSAQFRINTEDTMKFKADKDLALLVLDLYLPPDNNPALTLSFMKEFRKDRPEVPIIILSVHNPKPAELRDVVKARAGYFYRKPADDFDVDELTGLFRLAIEGAVSYSLEIASSIPNLVEDAFRREDPLSSREWSVLAFICKDMQTEVIAKRLGISAAGVRAHKAKIIKTLVDKQLIPAKGTNILCEWFRENSSKYGH